MSDEIKKERSRNCPSISLSAAIECAKKLHQKAGKAKVRAEVAAGALGYAGLNGAALTTLGALNQYGLVDREKGSMIGVSQAAIRIIHPLNKEQEVQTLQELALNPSVFKELFDGGFQSGAEDLIANHLIQNGFTPQKAKKSASVFKENVVIAKLENGSIIKSNEPPDFTLDDAPQDLKDSHAEMFGNPAKDKIKGKNVLAQYSIPIGASEATITFTGEKLSVEDFDALADYIAIFKKQFERKQKSEDGKQALKELDEIRSRS
jgi:hypothetical protein